MKLKVILIIAMSLCIASVFYACCSAGNFTMIFQDGKIVKLDISDLKKQP